MAAAPIDSGVDFCCLHNGRLNAPVIVDVTIASNIHNNGIVIRVGVDRSHKEWGEFSGERGASCTKEVTKDLEKVGRSGAGSTC
jgi:hypothetical protein